MSTGPEMTEEAALAEARRRWGARAIVWAQPYFGRHVYRVGVWTDTRRGAKRTQYGIGTTWERAFISADGRERRAASWRLVS